MNKLQQENTVQCYDTLYHLGEKGNRLEFSPENGVLANVTNLFDKPLVKYNELIIDAIQEIENERAKEFTGKELDNIYLCLQEAFDTRVTELAATELQAFIDKSLVNDDYIAIIKNYI